MSAALGGILALDLSSNLGWAYAPRSAERPRSGVWELPRAAVDMMATFAAAENRINDAITVHAPSLVVIEAPLPIQAQTDTFTAELMLGLDAIVRLAVWRHEIDCQRVKVGDVRKHATGTVRHGRDVKAAIVAAVQARGWPITDHNAADAALLWLYARDRIGAGRRAA